MSNSRLPQWLDGVLPDGDKSAKSRKPKPRLLNLEALEERAVPATFVVDNILDNGFNPVTKNPSLRQAMRDANTTPGHDRIVFNIPTNPSQPQVFSIRLSTELPALTDPAGVSIDATTQPGFELLDPAFGPRPIIEVTGTATNPGFSTDSGFTLAPGSGNNLIRGFIINSFPWAGIEVNASNNNVIVGNWIGQTINTDGSADALNPTATTNGLYQIVVTAGSSNNVIGGITDVTGKMLVDAGGNRLDQRFDSQGKTFTSIPALDLGDRASIDLHTKLNRNIMAGTAQIDAAAGGLGVGPGLRLQGQGTTGNLIQGNLIGSFADGSPAGNFNGVEILNGANNNFIGNPVTPGAQNVISNNTADGIRFAPTPFPTPAATQDEVPFTFDPYATSYYEAVAPDIASPNYPLIDLSLNAQALDQNPLNDADSINFPSALGEGVRGSKLFITGTGLTGTSKVTVGGVEADFRVIENVLQDFSVSVNTTVFSGGVPDGQREYGNPNFNAQALEVIIPQGAAYGLNAVVITTLGGTIDTSTLGTNGLFYDVRLSPTPVFQRFSDRNGNTITGALRGEVVNLRGNGLLSTSAVELNGVRVPFEVIDDTLIKVTLPNNLVNGPNQLRILNSGNTPGVFANALTINSTPAPVLNDFHLKAGPVGSRVTLYGRNLLGTSQVLFGGVAATQFTVDPTGERLTATVPLGAGDGPISVLTPGGTTQTTLPLSVTLSPAPVINTFTSGGFAGGTFGITGTGFNGTTGVLINGVDAEFEVVSDQEIVATIPLTATSGNLQVIGAGGTDDITDLTVDVFTVLTPPTPALGDIDGANLNISGFDQPDVGPVGTTITVTGDNAFAPRAVHLVTGVDLALPLDQQFNDGLLEVISIPRFHPEIAPTGYRYIDENTGANVPAGIHFEVPAGSLPGHAIVVLEMTGPATGGIDANTFNRDDSGFAFLSQQFTLPGTPRRFAPSYVQYSQGANDPARDSGAEATPFTRLEANAPQVDDRADLTELSQTYPEEERFRVGTTFVITPSPRAEIPPSGGGFLSFRSGLRTQTAIRGSDVELRSVAQVYGTESSLFPADILGKAAAVTPAGGLEFQFNQSLPGGGPGNPGVIELNGRGFTGATGVQLVTGTGVVVANVEVFDVESDTQIYFVVPDAPDGQYRIRVLTQNLPGNPNPQFVDSGELLTVMPNNAPNISDTGGVSSATVFAGTRFQIFGGPSTGSAAQGNFTGIQQVLVGLTPVRFRVLSDNVIEAVAETTGTGVTVIGPTGQDSFGGFQSRIPITDDPFLENPMLATANILNEAIDVDGQGGAVTANARGYFYGNTGAEGIVTQNITEARVGQRIFIAGVFMSGGSVGFTGGNVPRVGGEFIEYTGGGIFVTVPEGAATGDILISVPTVPGPTVDLTTPALTITDQPDPEVFELSFPNERAGGPQTTASDFFVVRRDANPIGNDVYANIITNNGALPDRGIDFYTGRDGTDKGVNAAEPQFQPPQGNDLFDADVGIFGGAPEGEGFVPAGGPNNGQNYPLLQIVQSSIDRTRIEIALVGQPYHGYRVDLYANPNEGAAASGRSGEAFIGTIFVPTDDQGLGRGEFTLDTTPDPLMNQDLAGPLPVGTSITAVATDLEAGTTLSALNLQSDFMVPSGSGTSRFSIQQAVDASTGGITGTVINDLNQSGFADPGEPGVAGVTVTLDLDSNGTIDATAMTNANGVFDFTMNNPNFNGLGLPNGTHIVTIVPPGGFVATNPEGASQSVTIINGEVVDVTFTIAQVGPDAMDDAFTVRPDIPPLELPVLANDIDFSGDTLAIIAVTQGTSGGSVVILDGGAGLTYQPAPGFNGMETFTYTVTDPDGNTDSATVTITVDPNANRPPIAVDDTAIIPPNAAAPINVLANDSDPDGDPLSITQVTLPGNGTAVISGGVVIYTPNPGFIGTDTFVYTISDGDLTDTATVTVTVDPTAPPPPPPPPPPIVTQPVPFVASGGANGDVTIFAVDQATALLSVQSTIQPFGAFAGQIRVANGDVNGDGVDDIVAGAGPGGAPRIRVISGADGTTIRDFFAFEPAFRGGVYVATADINQDGFSDLIIGADLGGGSRMRVLSGVDNSVLSDTFVYEPTFTGGVRVGAADVNGDGTPDILAGAGFLGGPRVVVFDGTDLTMGTRLADFFAFEQSQRDGVFVSGADVTGDGKAELVIGAGPGGGPRITVFNAIGASGEVIPDPSIIEPKVFNFFAFDSTDRTGVRVTTADLDGDANLDIIAAQGPGQGNVIKTYLSNGSTSAGEPLLVEEFFLNGDFLSNTGVWVG